MGVDDEGLRVKHAPSLRLNVVNEGAGEKR
ncbi:hypothetical protein SAMN05216599_105290 [Pseudomonas cichorii]|nr:hypothetical protein SAMN05216599_105290 [Pseudomonas cichorii]